MVRDGAAEKAGRRHADTSATTWLWLARLRSQAIGLRAPPTGHGAADRQLIGNREEKE
jgi:hypothetical protein